MTEKNLRKNWVYSMPIRFTQGAIRQLLNYFNMKPLKRGSFIYGGIGRDGKWRTSKFDYHRDRDQIATGTGKSIARSLGFKDTSEMKDFIDNNL